MDNHLRIPIILIHLSSMPSETGLTVKQFPLYSKVFSGINALYNTIYVKLDNRFEKIVKLSFLQFLCQHLEFKMANI